MGDLWVPPSLRRQYDDDNAKASAEVLHMVDRMRGLLARLTRHVRQKDPYLEVIFAPPTQDAEQVGLVPGRFHIMRHNPGAPPSLIPVPMGDRGEFVEPTESMLDRLLEERDLQNDRVVRDRARAKRDAEIARERQKQREREERIEELRDRYRAAFETSISLTDARPWTQNTRGRRAA